MLKLEERFTREFPLPSMASGLLRMDYESTSRVLQDNCSNSANPRMEGHRVSIGVREHLFRTRSLTL